MSMAMKNKPSATILWTFLLYLLSKLCLATKSDIECLQVLRGSVKDPENYLSWDFGNTSEGAICKFNGVECWHPDESKVLNLHLSNMRLQGRFPAGLENCTSLTGLDLSSNNLSGPIPEDISSRIPYVTSLDLSFNEFSGEIPINLSACNYLHSIKLDHNQLSGTIPAQLTRLDRLSSFDVSDNKLTGPIPQFLHMKLSAINFANNAGLCGKPLDNACEGSKKINMGVIIGSAIAGVIIAIIAIGLVLFYCLLKRPVLQQDLEQNKWAKAIKSAKGVKAS